MRHLAFTLFTLGCGAQIVRASEPIYMRQGDNVIQIAPDELKGIKIRYWEASYFRVGQSTSDPKARWASELAPTAERVMSIVRKNQRWEMAYDKRFGQGQFADKKGYTYFNYVGPIAVVDTPKAVPKSASKTDTIVEKKRLAAEAKKSSLLQSLRDTIKKEAQRMEEVLDTLGETTDPVRGILQKPSGLETKNPYAGIGTATREYADSVVNALILQNKLSGVLKNVNDAQLKLLQQAIADSSVRRKAIARALSVPVKSEPSEWDVTPGSHPATLADAMTAVKNDSAPRNKDELRPLPSSLLPRDSINVKDVVVEGATLRLVSDHGEARIGPHNSNRAMFVDVYDEGLKTYSRILFLRDETGVTKRFVLPKSTPEAQRFWASGTFGESVAKTFMDVLNRFNDRRVSVRLRPHAREIKEQYNIAGHRINYNYPVWNEVRMDGPYGEFLVSTVGQYSGKLGLLIELRKDVFFVFLSGWMVSLKQTVGDQTSYHLQHQIGTMGNVSFDRECLPEFLSYLYGVDVPDSSRAGLVGQSGGERRLEESLPLIRASLDLPILKFKPTRTITYEDSLRKGYIATRPQPDPNLDQSPKSWRALRQKDIASLQSGQSSLEKREFIEANRSLTAAAVAGNTQAKALLGKMYEQGWGGPSNANRAEALYIGSSRTGDPEGQRLYGQFLLSHSTESDDHYRAAMLLGSAAAQGDEEAAIELGKIYHAGQGVASDYIKEARCYQLAVDRGSVAATVLLAECYEKGSGVAQDSRKQFELLTRAAQKGDAPSALRISTILLDPGNANRDVDQAALYLVKAIQLNSKEAQETLLNLEQNLKELIGRLATEADGLKVLQSKVTSASSVIQKTRRNIQDAKAKIDTMEEERDVAKRDVVHADGQVEYWQGKVDECKSLLDQANDAISIAGATILLSESQRALRNARQDSERAQSIVDKRSEEIAQLQTSVKTLEDSLSPQTKTLKEAEQGVETAKQRVANLQKSLAPLQEFLTAVQSHLPKT